MTPTNRLRWKTALLAFLVACSSFVFLPGKSGPFIFDDYTNLIDNSYIKVTSLDFESLHTAAYSLDAGPLQRPIAMLSFALNYYWAGGFSDSAPYKLVNIAIHAINGLLVFWLMLLILDRLSKTRTGSSSKLSKQTIPVLAAATAILWSVHPIQVSGTLYVVQRMAELSALFTLLAIICYLLARQVPVGKNPRASWILGGCTLAFGTLGMLSKENALLLPIFIGALELILYSSERPWKRWGSLTPRVRYAIGFLLVAVMIAGTIYAVLYALPTYSMRTFSMYERVLTESRVLFFYLFLIFIPQLNQFGHQHDDIVISTSLLSPWTTLPSLVGHVMLILAAILLRKRHPLIALGILWFYIAHLLESTILALEIAHEHRNYLALLGPVWVIIGLIEAGKARFRWRQITWLVALIALVFGTITMLRAEQWSNHNSFYRYESMHHPKSPRVQLGLSILLEAQGRHAEAAVAVRKAIDLQPDEVGNLLQLHLISARQGILPTPAEQDQTVELLKTSILSATTFMALQHTTNCLQSWCKSLQVPLETWARTVIDRPMRDKSYYYYLLGMSLTAQGKTYEAINSLRLAYESDPAYLHPLFMLASIYVQLGQDRNAELILNELKQANSRVDHRRDREIAAVERDIEKLRVKSISQPDR